MSRQNPELDEALQLLEEELRAMTPSAPSDGLRTRVLHALQSAQGSRESQQPLEHAAPLKPPGRAWFGWVPVAAAASVALMAVVLFPSNPGNSPELVNNNPQNPTAAKQTAPVTPLRGADFAPAGWQPTGTDSRLEDVAYDGLRQKEQTTYRQVRTRYMERRTFRNPKDGTTVEVMVPREHIRLLPVIPE